MKNILRRLRRMGPYVALAIIVPGGSLLSFLLWLARRRAAARALSAAPSKP